MPAPKARPRLIELATGEHQSVLVAPDELQRQVEASATEAERVEEAHATVHGTRGRTLAVDLAITVDPDSEIRRVISDVQERVAVGLSSRYGVTLRRKPNIEVRYAGTGTARRRNGEEDSDGTRDDEPRRIAS